MGGSNLQWAILLVNSALIFGSYQAIPGALAALSRAQRFSSIVGLVTSGVFQAFIRFCGMDHIIMAGGMILAMKVVPEYSYQIFWVIVASSTLVAVVSVGSALIVHHEKIEETDNAVSNRDTGSD